MGIFLSPSKWLRFWLISPIFVIQENSAFSTELRSVQFWIVNQETCRNRYRALGFEVTDNMVCAGWLDVGVRGQCQVNTRPPLDIGHSRNPLPLSSGVGNPLEHWTDDASPVVGGIRV